MTPSEMRFTYNHGLEYSWDDVASLFALWEVDTVPASILSFEQFRTAASYIRGSVCCGIRAITRELGIDLQHAPAVAVELGKFFPIITVYHKHNTVLIDALELVVQPSLFADMLVLDTKLEQAGKNRSSGDDGSSTASSSSSDSASSSSNSASSMDLRGDGDVERDTDAKHDDQDVVEIEPSSTQAKRGPGDTRTQHTPISPINTHKDTHTPHTHTGHTDSHAHTHRASSPL